MKMKIGSDTEKKHNYDTFQKYKNRQNWLKLIYSEKATKFCEISTVDLTGNT